MEVYNLIKAQLEDHMDVTKEVVIGALVSEGVLDKDIAEEWSATHTIILRKKSFFRTLSNKWNKEKKSDNDFLLCVKKI